MHFKKSNDNQSTILHEGSVPYLTFKKLDQAGVRHGFSTRMVGVSEGMFSTLNLSYNRGDKKEAVDENFRRISEAIGFDHTKLVFSNQIHETRIHKVTKEDCGKVMKDMDGLATNEQGIPLYTGYADCVPLFFYDPVEKAAALAHSGWRGTVGRIGAKMVQFLENEYGSKKENIIAAIGPSICRSCYEVSEDVADEFKKELTGHDAKIVGDDNAKNGADRVVDGVNIQSKYCATGKRCINECFENDGKGTFRYMTDGKPMKIEVPSDKYDEAVRAMEEKIKNGQVKGVSDPNEAKNIVKKGHFTYAQAKNIAKAGTVESLTYDAVNGTIIASSAFGVTAMITFATSMWNGEDFEDAIKIATYSGLKVGGTAFITSILAAQLSKAGLNSALVGSSEAIVAMMGPKASAVLINAFRVGSKPIYGAAAMKAAAKLLRSNTITAGITFVVLSSFDVANIFRGRISGKQLFKNMANTAATVGAGTGGWVAGAAIGSAIPGIGTIVGGLVGSMVAGSAAGKVTNAVVGSFIEDDADKMVEIIQDVFTEMASEYLLSNKEAEKSVDRLKDKLDGKTLKDMFASNDRKKFARNLLIPIIENQISKREVIHKLTEEQMLYGIREVLEDISDMEESYA